MVSGSISNHCLLMGKVDFGKARVMVRGSISKDCLLMGKVEFWEG